MILFFFASLLSGILISAMFLHRKKRYVFIDKHVVVSGGSSGIGKEIARIAVEEGARVTIVARNEQKLKDTCDEIREEDTNVGYVAVDLSSNIDVIKNKFEPAIKARGNVDILINCAGSAVARYVEETSEEMYRNMMDVNFFSAVNLTKALLESLESRCTATRSASVVFTSSIAGLMGVFGYSAYSPSKFALVGFAQTLRAEKLHRGLHVMVAFPPDTETPGYENENIGKPVETLAISEMGGLQKPNAVARGILEDLSNKRLTSSFGLDGQFLCTAASGLWPVGSGWKLLSEICLISPGRLLGAYLHWAFHRCAAVARSQRNRR